MWKKWTVYIVIFLLRHAQLAQPERTLLFNTVIDLSKTKSLDMEERQILTAMLLEKLGALPLHAKIRVDKTGRVVVNGRSLDLDAATRLQQAAASMQTNAARSLVRETVTFMAVMEGVHKAHVPDQMLFSKAALWFLQEEDALYAELAQTGLETDE